MAWTQVTGRRLRGELPRRLLQRWRQSSSSTASSASKREEVPSSSQLARLALVTGVPFVGFGIADNGIMILAGDAIDSTIGVTLGLSTLAAAGLGNLLSDVVGIGAGDVIERFCYRMGLREPPLSAAQQTMNRTRHVKTGASVLGIAVGCIIGMFPLLFLSDRKKLYFNDKELELYESVFQPFGVNPHHFFDLLHSAKWRTVEPGAPIVQAGAVMDRVVLVHSGRLDSFGTRDDGSKFFLYSYFGKTSLGVNPEEEDPSTKRGSIIGGTALVNMSVIRDPYPNTVVASKRSEVLEWNIAELRKQMKEDKAIEAAVFSTLYLDLVEGLQRQRKDQQRLASVDRELKDQALHEFSILIKAVISDGMVHPSERQMVREFMATNDISRADLGNLIEDLGWTLEDWDKGVKADSRNHTLEEKIKNIPEMLRSANIRSRITESDEKVSK